MSVRAVSWAIDQAPVGGNTTARMILVSLADKADEYGRDAYKYVSAIADSIRKSDSTVSRTLAWMEEIGVIERGNQHLVDSYPEYLRPVVYDLRLDLVQEPTPRQIKKARPGRPRKLVKDPRPEDGKTLPQNETGFFTNDEKSSEANDSNENKTLSQNETGFFEESDEKENPVAPVHPPRSHQCTHPGRTSALHNVLKHPKTTNPSLPTGELPASGKRQPDGKDQTRTDTTGQQSPAMDDARDVLDHLGLMRSKLGLSTPASNKTDQRAVCKLIVQTTEANKGDRARALMLILAVVDWMASNTFWLRRVLTGRQLHANWDKIANDYAVSLIEHQRDLDAAAREQDKPRRAGRVLPPARVPDPYVAPRHVHTFCCEHVLADMKTHEDDYDHEGSVRYGQPSAWQRACMEHADELNRRDGIDIESAA